MSSCNERSPSTGQLVRPATSARATARRCLLPLPSYFPLKSSPSDALNRLGINTIAATHPLFPRTIMLRLRDGQGTLWDEFLPPEVRVLSDELTAIDTLLDDPSRHTGKHRGEDGADQGAGQTLSSENFPE
jgi:hypothetical protein